MQPAKGANQVAHLRQLARQYRISFTREIVQCETMIDSLNLLDGDIQRGKLLGTEGYIADMMCSIQGVYAGPEGHHG